MDTESDSKNRPRPGSPEPTVKLDLTFEEAAARLMRAKKPSEGLPDFRTRQRRGKGFVEG